MRGGYMQDNVKMYYGYFQEHGDHQVNGRHEGGLPDAKIVDDDSRAVEPEIVLMPYADEENKKAKA